MEVELLDADFSHRPTEKVSGDLMMLLAAVSGYHMDSRKGIIEMIIQGMSN